MIVLVVALIVFGPEKLPEIARTVGRTANQLKRMASDVKDDFQSGLDMSDDDDEPRSQSPAAGALPTAETGTTGSASSNRAKRAADHGGTVEHDIERLNSDAKVDATEAPGPSSSLRGRPLEEPSRTDESTDQDRER